MVIIYKSKYTCMLLLLLPIIFSLYNIKKPYYTNYLKNKNKEPTSCNDFIYGCCEIYTDCSYSHLNTIVVNTTYIDWNANVKFNEKGSNCDRIRDIVVEYNTYQNKGLSNKDIFKNVASCSIDSYLINDCCTVDYNCDLRYYYDFKSYHYNISNYKDFFSTTYGNITLYINKDTYMWAMGICPTFQEVINIYETSRIEYNNRIPIIYYILICLSITSILFITFYNSKKKYVNINHV